MSIKNSQRGFTLIELLVVIVIIGILASVVLASLNSARAKGADAAIKANLANIRAQAELLYDNNDPDSYSGLCADTTVLSAMNSAASALGGTVDSTLANVGAANKVSCHLKAVDFSAWAISSGLKSSTTDSWCVDSTGASKQVTGFLAASATAC